MSFYALSALINGIVSTLVGFFVISRNRKDPRYITYSLFTLSVAVWSYFYFIWQISQDANIALFCSRGLMVGAIFIPVCYLHHLFIFFNIYEKRKRIIYYGYLGGLIFLFLDFTPLFVKNVTPKLVFKFWPNPGIAYHPFLVLWIWYVIYGIYIIFKEYKNSIGLKREQLKYVLLATFIGWVGGFTNYPLWYDIPILPVGNIFVSGYMLIVAYAIIRYRLMDINIALTRAGIFTIVYSLVLGIPFWIGYHIRSWFIPTFLGVSLANVGPFIYNYFRRRAERLLLREQYRYQETLRAVSSTMTLVKDLDRLLKLIVYRVARTVKVDFACIYLADESQKRFIQKIPYTKLGFFPALAKELGYDSPVISFIKEKHKPIFAEEIPFYIKKDFYLRAGLIVPSFVRERLLGLLLLGPKSSGSLYTQDDARIFEILANQAALAIENARFITESQKAQARLFAVERMSSLETMAGGMSHQLNNRFHAIVMATSDTLDTLKFIEPEKLTKEQLKDYLSQIRYALCRIQENACQGGRIINNFLNFSQPDRIQKKAKELNLKEPLERGIEMVKIKTSLANESIYKEIPKELPLIKGDFVLLQDVFFNLVDNAVDALRKKKMAIEEGAFLSLKEGISQGLL